MRKREPAGPFSRRSVLQAIAGSSATYALAAAGQTGERATVARRPSGVLELRDGRDQPFDAGWRFLRGDADAAERSDFDDRTWRIVDTPHDWSIEDLPDHPESDGEGSARTLSDMPAHVGPFDRYASAGQGATGWVVGGTGWYRKHFSAANLAPGRRVEIRFDGVYMDCDVWLNGTHLGNHPYGYTTFAFDLTPAIRHDAENVIAVRVRNAGKNSRWYSGSGIFRHVWTTVTGDARFPLWSVRVRTADVSPESATVHVDGLFEQHAGSGREVKLLVLLLDPDRKEIARRESAGPAESWTETFNIAAPKLWSPATPSLYAAEVAIADSGRVSDRVRTTFGIRTVEVDAERGLRINGQPVKLRGGCVHHDNGVLGAAAIDRAEERRIELLKTNGFNAVRCSHNPPSPAFLDACDRLGMLVIDEAFDMWQAAKNPMDYHRFFDEWWKRDIDGMVLRDRNHPSVIFWSIGNEVHERAEPEGVEIAARLVGRIRELDSSRPITAAICDFWDYPGRKRSWSDADPAFKHLDIGGYNYQWQQYEKDRGRHPKRIIAGTESFPKEAFENWALVEKHPYVLGDFVWTALDYLGESGLGHAVLSGEGTGQVRPFPWFNAYCGDIDLIGEKKPQSYFRDVVWGRSKLEIAVQRPVPEGQTEEVSAWGWSDELRSWTWPGHEGKPLRVRVYSSGSEVRLALNGREIGRKPVGHDTKLTAEFEVPYARGELRAVAFENGNEIASATLRTAGKPSQLRARADRSAIRASRNDLAFVTVEVLDQAGNLVPDAVVPVRFAIEGPAELAGVGNANPKDMASFRRPHRKTFHGKCLAVVRSNGSAGAIAIRAEAEGLRAASVIVSVR